MGLTLCPCYYIITDPPQIHARTKFISFISATSSILQGEPQEESQVTQHEKLVDDVQKEAHGEEQADLTRSEFVTSEDQRTAVAALNNHERGCRLPNSELCVITKRISKRAIVETQQQKKKNCTVTRHWADVGTKNRRGPLA